MLGKLKRNLIEQKILLDNFEWVKQCERIDYQKLRLNHIQSVEMLAEMEQLLKTMFSFWEDIIVVPQKFEKNYQIIYNISKRFITLKGRLELFCKAYVNTKLVKTFLVMGEMFGFPGTALKRTFHKIIMNNENSLEKAFTSIRIRNTYLHSRKTAIVIVSAAKDSIGEVLYASSLVKEVLNLQASDMRGAQINSFMPLCYAQVHNKMVENYIEKQDAERLKSRNFIAFAKDGAGYLHK